MRKIELKIIFMMVIDLCLVYYAFFFASLLLHDFKVHDELIIIIKGLFWIFPLYLVMFGLFKFYKLIWEFASVEEVMHIVLAVLTSSIFMAFFSAVFEYDLFLSLIILSHLILLLFLVGFRYRHRIIKQFYDISHHKNKEIKTLIIGAGSGGASLIKQIKSNKRLLNKVICLVDDDVNKVGKVIQGIRVVGTTYELDYIVFKYQIEEILVSIPSASRIEFQKILEKCETLKVKVKVFPPFYQLMDRDFRIDRIRDVEPSDLLGRDEVKIDSLEIYTFLNQEVVLVTGGGGSIGSELCRQILLNEPKTLIIFDQYENNAYHVEHELLGIKKGKKLETDIMVLIGSVQDEDRVREIFKTYHVSIVFHAAAHKHVPLMETSPKEAIKNNVFGTYNVARCAHVYKAKHFVLISSDKAVNPTNIMGATKRLSEMIINAFNGISLTQYAAVRFGNVLGSNGSVVPLFKKQIENGGPVTVTHKDVIRYFMTIREAVSLVLQAGSYSRGGEIFVLDMGKPMKILNLAENLIRLSGYEPYEDIDILITGLRPGDKLYEELLTKDEKLSKTPHEKIFMLRQNLIYLDQIDEYLEELKYLISIKNGNISQVMKKLIPTYHHQSMEEGIV